VTAFIAADANESGESAEAVKRLRRAGPRGCGVRV
jgi:hypothetical protein